MKSAKPTNKLNDIVDARVALRDLAALTRDLAVHDARKELAICVIKKNHTDVTQFLKEGIKNLRASLSKYIKGHKKEFTDPRKVVTDFGSFGLHYSESVVIKKDSDDMLITWLMEQGYTHCIQTTHTPLKEGIKKLIESGVPVPFCSIAKGDDVVIEISDAFLEKKQGRKAS